MLLKAALNGDRTFAEHPNIPMSPAQVAADAHAVVALGVGAIHVHPRADDGAESLNRADIEHVVLAIRERCPKIPVGVSTGEWIMPDVNERLRTIAQWQGIVDFASVNFSEPGAVDVAHVLLELGIGVEAGLFNAEAAKVLAECGLAERCLRLMFEPIDKATDDALQTVDAIEAMLELHQVENSSRLLHGLDTTAWPLLEEARNRGYDTRIGFEDTLFLPTGKQAKDNAVLVDAAKKLLANSPSNG